MCVCIYISGPHGSGFHHRDLPASRNLVIRHVNAVITHHYPEVQVVATPFSPESAEADIPHLFTASGWEKKHGGVEPEGRVGGYGTPLDNMFLSFGH